MSVLEVSSTLGDTIKGILIGLIAQKRLRRLVAVRSMEECKARGLRLSKYCLHAIRRGLHQMLSIGRFGCFLSRIVKLPLEGPEDRCMF